MKQEDYLREKIRSLAPQECTTPDRLVRGLRRCAFQGRALAYAVDVWEAICRDENCLRVISLAGAMVPAGMGELVATLLERGLLDVVVCTGATIAHDLCNICADGRQAHYIGDPFADDVELRELEINRVYDTYVTEAAFYHAEHILDMMLKDLDYERHGDLRVIPTAEFCRQVGQRLEGRGILTVAARMGVPIFIPAISDSELGLNVVAANERNWFGDGSRLVFDTLADVEHFGRLICGKPRAGLVSVGGGVPRNWAQQIYPFLNMKTREEKAPATGYQYGVRITTDRPEFGGLSGCTISESKSWGKYEKQAKEATVISDAAIALPLMVSALLERLGTTG
ncbi:MAG TPA: hypothetical protein EYP62_06465 [Kiritimatiellae bacterium]|nr:hypothetical protein [Kiritimatiellia bacterium]